MSSSELPAGLVTFLFTDIESSTRLFHRLGEGAVEVLDRKRAIIRRACEAHGGHYVAESGDSSFLAFSSASAALAAADEAQQALDAADWPEGVQLRVRMGLHSGMAWPHQGDYIALTVHQASRVMAAAHGGQTLVSEHIHHQLDDADRSRLSFLGRFRLRDFDEPVGLYQLGTAEHPSVRALPADRHNIVRRPTDTIGREETIDEVAALLHPGSLVTLTGPGGVGKTRVAAEVGTRLAHSWPDGVWMVDLAPIGDEELVVSAIAEAVGAPRHPDRDRRTDLLEHLQGRQAVVVLDNCEHLLDTCRRLVGEMLSRYPTVAVLATSREPLRLPGEEVRPVAPLATPPPEATAETIPEWPAVRLFIERARAARPDLDADPVSMAEICRRLDGLPLFIELAAANVAFRSIPDLRRDLEQHLTDLRAWNPSVPDRHRDLEAVLGWSYRLLDPDEQAGLRRLSVFGSSFTLESAVEAISSGDVAAPPEQVVWSLVDRSLVTPDLAANDTRYRLLETVRAFARRELDDAGESLAVTARLVSTFLDRLGPSRPASLGWMGEVAVEIDNLRSLIPEVEDEEHAQQLAYTIGRFHDSTHAFREGIEELSRYLESLQEPTPTRSSLLALAAYLHLRVGDTEQAERLVDAADRLRAEHGAPAWDDVGVDRTRGEIARRRGDLETAAEIAERALERELSERGRSRMLNLLCTTSAALGDTETAYQAGLEELEINRSLGYDEYVAAAEGNLAEVAMRRGDPEAAAAHQRACLEMASAQGSEPMLAFSMIVAARLAEPSEEWETVVRLLGCAERILEDIGLVLYEDDQEQIERLSAAALRGLGATTFARTWTEGRELSMPDGVRLADSMLEAAATVRA